MTNNFMQVGAMQGWQCPICKRVLAPFVQECPCKGQGMETVTTTGNGTLTLNEEMAKHIPTVPTCYCETGVGECEDD